MATEIKTVKSITLVTPLESVNIYEVTILRLNVKLAHSEESFFVYVVNEFDAVKQWLNGKSILNGVSNFIQRNTSEGNVVLLTSPILFGIDAGKTAQVEIAQVYKFKVGD